MDRRRGQPVSLASPISEVPWPVGTFELGGLEAVELKDQVKHDNLRGLREYLARTRKEGDWQDRVFMLGLVVPDISPGTLNEACESEPEAADLFLIRCAFFSELAWEMRGTGTCDQVTKERFRNSAECVQLALEALEKACQLDAQDPTACVCILPALHIFGQLIPRQQRAFHQAIETAPDLVPAYRATVTCLSKRWYGSHEKSLQLARSAMSKAKPGSDIAVCLFWAHTLVRSHYSSFDKRPWAAKRYLHNPEVTKELNSAFDSWVQPPYSPRRSSIPYLHYAAHWYYLAGDRERLKQALSLTSNVFSRMPWAMRGDAQTEYSRALLFASGDMRSPASNQEPLVWLFLHLFKASRDRIAKLMKKLRRAPGPEEECIEALGILRKQAEEDPSEFLPQVAKKLGELAKFHLDHQRIRETETTYDEMIAIRRKFAAVDPDTHLRGLANAVNDLAALYLKTQRFREAEQAFKESLSIYRKLTEKDPIIYLSEIAEVLNNLANVYRSCQRTVESEKAYSEALNIHRKLAEANPGGENPKVAMVLSNLAILYKDTKRFSEAEEAYSESLKIRRHLALYFPAMYQAKVAITLNNLAELYRVTQRLHEAEKTYAKALAIFRKMAKTEPAANLYYVATLLNNLGELHCAVRRFSEAEKEYDEALSIRRNLADANPNVHLHDLALTVTCLAELYWNTQRLDESQKASREADAILEPLWHANSAVHGDKMARNLLVRAKLSNETAGSKSEALLVAQRALSAAYDANIKEDAQQLIDILSR